MIRATNALAAARKSERDATDQLFAPCCTGPAPAAPAGRWASGWTASPRWSGPHASGPTGGCATRPSPPWPCPTSAACRSGTLAPGHRGGGVRRSVRPLRPRGHPGGHQHPQHRRRPRDPAHRLGPHPGEPTCSSAPTIGSCSVSGRGITLRCGDRRRAARPPRRAPRLSGTCVQPRWPTRWRSPGKNGSSASIWRRVGKCGVVACAGRPTRLAFHPDGRKLAVGYFESQCRLGVRRGETEPSSRTCPSVAMSTIRSSPGIPTASVWPSRAPTRASRSGT